MQGPLLLTIRTLSIMLLQANPGRSEQGNITAFLISVGRHYCQSIITAVSRFLSSMVTFPGFKLSDQCFQLRRQPH